MRESSGNTFYCAECTYDKSNGTMFLYTTDITEVRGSVKPKDSMKVEGGFLVRRKYFRSEYEAQEYIDSLPNAMPMSRNESFEIHPLKTAKVYHPDFDSFDLFSCDESTKNQFLGRFVADCRYFLGNGNGYEGHLWAGSVEEQIDLMRKLYDDIRPDWLSERQIDDFEDKMLQLKYSKTESIRRLGEGNSNLKLKKVKTGKYTTTDGNYEIEKSDGFWYAVDTKTGQSVVDCENSLSAIKDSLESYIKSHGKKESFRRLREGDASKKTNYAVIVRNMNKWTYNLYTGTKADCEQLLSDLDSFESFANECDDENEYFAEEEYIIDLLSSYGCLPEIYRNMIDRNDNYNVGLHYGDYLGGMIHIINADSPIDLYIW